MSFDTHSGADYGLIGRPLGHSQSKAFFTRLFAEEGCNERYENFELDELSADTLHAVFAANRRLKGFNVTAPYKIAIMGFLEKLSSESERTGAVNTVKIHRNAAGEITLLEGHNTDVTGFRESVLPMAEQLADGRGALVLGTGGASKAVLDALRQLGVRATLVSRSKRLGAIGYNEIDSEILRNNPLIINATPLGTYPNTEECPPLPYSLITRQNLCHDLVYNPAETEFMRRCAAQGAVVKNGLEMLHSQALASLKIWRTP